MAVCWSVPRLVYEGYGERIVEAAYRGKAWSMLNSQIRGQAVYPLEYYQRLADELFERVWWLSLLVAGSVVGARIFANGYRKRMWGKRGLVLFVGCVAAAALFPFTFRQIFALDALSTDEATQLGLSSVLVPIIAYAITTLPSRFARPTAAVFGVVVLLIGCELGARLAVAVRPVVRMQMAHLADATYPERMRYRAHPFLQFTGTPATQFKSDALRERHWRYNDLGFIGGPFHYKKPPGTVRVACLGGSTTESGYPKELETHLNGKTLAGERYEVFNFGIAAWNSGHSLVNFVLNVRTFRPDYVVIHHGWNDGAPRTIGPGAPGDYSASLKPFEPRVPLDRPLIRASVLYRLLRSHVNPRPDFAMLEGAVSRDTSAMVPAGDGEDTGVTFIERNLRTMIDLAQIDRSSVVLATMPHSTAPDASGRDQAIHIDRNNEIVRKLATQYGSAVLLTDLDRLMTGCMNQVFTDLAHVNAEGDRFKAKAIGDTILNGKKGSGVICAKHPSGRPGN